MLANEYYVDEAYEKSSEVDYKYENHGDKREGVEHKGTMEKAPRIPNRRGGKKEVCISRKTKYTS